MKEELDIRDGIFCGKETFETAFIYKTLQTSFKKMEIIGRNFCRSAIGLE